MAWEQLGAIAAEAAEHRRAEQAEPPRTCPNDANVLEPGPTPGTLHCPFDGWTWPTDRHN